MSATNAAAGAQAATPSDPYRPFPELRQYVAQRLLAIGAVKFGDFLLKSGERSSTYYDLRLIQSYPRLYGYLTSLARPYADEFKATHVTGVMRGGLGLSHSMSLLLGLKHLIIRDAPKQHGTGSCIDGLTADDAVRPVRLLVIEDVTTTGASAWNFAVHARSLLPSGSSVRIVTILDRTSGSIPEITGLLWPRDFTAAPLDNMLWYAYAKQSNVILALDIQDVDEALIMLRSLASKIMGVKIHLDCMRGDVPAFIKSVAEIASQERLVVINDRKLLDIEAIMERQIEPTQPSWYTTVHALVGTTTLCKLKAKGHRLIPVAEMSTGNAAFDSIRHDEETVETLLVEFGSTGIVCQESTVRALRQAAWENDMPPAVTISPGISMTSGSDGMDQKWQSIPKMAGIKCDTAGILWVIGRGILSSSDPIDTAQIIRTAGYEWFLHF